MKQENSTDLYNVEQRLIRVLEKVDEVKIPKSNKKKIVEFKNHCLACGTGKNKVSRYLYDLIHIAVWLDKPFENAKKRDIEKVMVRLEEAKGEQTKKPFSEWTKRGYRILIRKFYKWLRGTRYYPDEVDWIQIRIKECKKQLPEDMLSEREVLALINHCTNVRDKALIAFLYDSGCRVGELLNIKIKDIEYFEQGMKIYLHGKTGTRRIPIIFSVPFVSVWLNHHPDKNENSYLWVKNNSTRMSYGRVRDLFKECAKRARITKKVNPHNFRHSRASAYSDKLSDRVMMEYFGWKKSDTISIYSHLNGKQIENAILGANDVVVEKKKEDSLLKPKKCARCGKDNEASAIFCNCGFPLNEKVAEEIKQKEMRRQKAEQIVDKIINDPELWSIIKQKIQKDSD